MAILLTSNIDDTLTAARWRSLKLYNGYRLLIAILFLVTQSAIGDDYFLQNTQLSFFFQAWCWLILFLAAYPPY